MTPIIDDDRCENKLGLLMSLNMLNETPGGCDTGADCENWMLENAFKKTSVLHLTGSESMVIGQKL